MARERTAPARDRGFDRASAWARRSSSTRATTMSATTESRSKTPSSRSSACGSAIERTRRELDEIRQRIGDEAPADYRAILDAHMMMHRDELDRGSSRSRRSRRSTSTPSGRSSATVTNIAHHLAQAPVDYLRERAVDIEHVGRRIIAQLDRARIIAADRTRATRCSSSTDLHPADAAQLIETPVAALVTGLGSATSHTAILARALGHPGRRRRRGHHRPRG